MLCGTPYSLNDRDFRRTNHISKMKRILIMACCIAVALQVFSTTSTFSTTMNNNEIKMMVISDIHLLAPSLHDNGKASQSLAQADMKMVLGSDLIMQRMVDDVIARKPQLLLIAGDLTFNGSRASHERLLEHLRRLEQAGVHTLVIPGNHDVNCPYSKSYIGDVPTPVPTVTADEFSQLYAHFGYGESSVRDPNSLSYICEPVPGLMLLCIDSNRCNENRLAQPVVYHSDGTIKPETLSWMASQLALARASGKKVVAMMHHHLLEHIDGETKLLPNYIVASHGQVAQVLRQGGVKAVFTGHLHITDAVTLDGLTDIATGSASTFPLPMRELSIDAALDTMRVSTSFFDGLEPELLQQGKAQVENSAGAIASIVARKLWPRLSARLGQMKELMEEQGIDVSRLPQSDSQLSAMLLKHLREPLAQSLVIVSQGGEDPRQANAIIEAVKQGVRNMVAEVLPDDDGTAADFLIENAMPRVEPVLRSALEDINHMGTPKQSTTHDHSLTLGLD